MSVWLTLAKSSQWGKGCALKQDFLQTRDSRTDSLGSRAPDDGRPLSHASDTSRERTPAHAGRRYRSDDRTRAGGRIQSLGLGYKDRGRGCSSGELMQPDENTKDAERHLLDDTEMSARPSVMELATGTTVKRTGLSSSRAARRATSSEVQRPLTRYLPVDRDDFDLRRHIETAVRKTWRFKAFQSGIKRPLKYSNRTIMARKSPPCRYEYRHPYSRYSLMQCRACGSGDMSFYTLPICGANRSPGGAVPARDTELDVVPRLPAQAGRQVSYLVEKLPDYSENKIFPRWFVFDRDTKTFVYYWDKSERKPRGGAYFQENVELFDFDNPVRRVSTSGLCYGAR
ncbi:hypothetical protein EVAR_16417_1 [Eumeta japonica]|uniref:Uncharacterized protein n=1 Tax=Eumeta variegata TaxID=151549 RepID=A0A4C1UL75_EUMVA|nr:hypothetical protein EVAR_16417_1 [Eumeta japonica]